MDAQDLLERLRVGVLVVAADGQIVYGNGEAARILGRPPGRLRGRSIGDVLLPLAALPSPGPTRHERLVRLPSGESTVVGLRVDDGDDSGGRTLLVEDLTPLLELRRQRDKLLQLAALGDALPSMLHELRNPLAAITSVLEVLVEGAGRDSWPGSDAERPDLSADLHAVLWEVRRMSLTLQGVGSLARSVHVDEPVAVDHAVEEAVRVLAPTAARKGVTLTAAVATLPLLPLDWGVVSGVVFNLTRNAIDACRPGDRIVVSAGRDEAAGLFLLRVEDSGPGMPDEVLARSCELFFTTKEHGSGVGLALCKQIAESSGGEFNITSAPGAGTTVSMEIPYGDLLVHKGE